MEPIRYKPGEAIRWIQEGAQQSRRSAKQKGKDLIAPGTGVGVKKIGQGVGALIDLGKGAWADVLHSQAEASEYVIQEDRFDVVHGNSIKPVPYAEIRRISIKGDKISLTLDRGVTIAIKPYAYIVAGRIKVPVGWLRNGMEVPYELLIDEIAARCGIDVDQA